MNCSKFQEDIQSNLATVDEGLSLEEMMHHYNKATKLALVENAPLKTKWLHVNHQHPWFNDKIKEEIRLWRQKENAWLKDPTPTHTRHFSTNAGTAQTTSRANSEGFYIDKIHECRNDFKEIFCLTNNLLNSKQSTPTTSN